jgi:hypothetical protein
MCAKCRRGARYVCSLVGGRKQAGRLLRYLTVFTLYLALSHPTMALIYSLRSHMAHIGLAINDYLAI